MYKKDSSYVTQQGRCALWWDKYMRQQFSSEMLIILQKSQRAPENFKKIDPWEPVQPLGTEIGGLKK